MLKNIFLKRNDSYLIECYEISKVLNEILNQNSEIIKSLGHDYKNSFKKKQLSIIKKKPIGNVIITCLNMKQAKARTNKGAEEEIAITSIKKKKFRAFYKFLVKFWGKK